VNYLQLNNHSSNSTLCRSISVEDLPSTAVEFHQAKGKMAIGQSMPKGSLATSLSFPSSGSTRILGRKRVAVSPAPSPSGPHSPVRALRKQRSIRFHMDDTVCLLESLPQDVLVRTATRYSLLFLPKLLVLLDVLLIPI
jgi:hypothetical protein